MSIVAQAARVGTVAIAPGGNLHTGIPLVEFLFLGGRAAGDSRLRPMAQTEF